MNVHPLISTVTHPTSSGALTDVLGMGSCSSSKPGEVGALPSTARGSAGLRDAELQRANEAEADVEDELARTR